MSTTASEIAPLSFEDASSRPRCGCKGPGAEDWLRSAGYRVPVAPNSAVIDDAGVFIARLASSEFLLESLHGAGDATGAARIRASRSDLSERAQPPTVYAVARMDVVTTISGSRLNALLREICSVDFAPMLEGVATDAVRSGQPVVLTSMVGVGVVAWPHAVSSGPAVTLWCEPSYGHYFLNTLREVAHDIDGGR
jgi:sarcosine oxidase subunit gamma